MARAGLAALAAALLALHAPTAAGDDAVDAAVRCLAKQLRKHDGPEGGRASAMKGHFECFPDDPQRFVALFGAAGALAADHGAHLELFFAARPAIGERKWSSKAVGVLAGGSWTAGAVDLYGDLLLQQLKARAPALLDAAARLDDAALASFWQALFGGEEGFAPDASVCVGREAHRACSTLSTLR